MSVFSEFRNFTCNLRSLELQNHIEDCSHFAKNTILNGEDTSDLNFAVQKNVNLFSAICRVLLERLIVNRPHPWGLLVTFIELIRNQSYKFWGHEFVHCSPEIERLFETVARSCNQTRSQPTSAAAGAPQTSIRAESGELPAM